MSLSATEGKLHFMGLKLWCFSHNWEQVCSVTATSPLKGLKSSMLIWFIFSLPEFPEGFIDQRPSEAFVMAGSPASSLCCWRCFRWCQIRVKLVCFWDYSDIWFELLRRCSVVRHGLVQPSDGHTQPRHDGPETSASGGKDGTDD